uniref:DUF1302 domain-containing protein n=1 Tax=Candidatus Kentrum sp. FM TaxID=2126340 RepID=A0A450WAH1_9GAMM|nr:MAG: Protein of unknown function (DUF1302) [Candidatus Kentron sp. FM]VFJ62572.1 MAG: Protein of unknown function (DUF1302) [Candidatus Kentron sp. FM]VFK14027.1 MAG: Protein of unknown function (DUF1302) [Candidatus Kentron sp. FM]
MLFGLPIHAQAIEFDGGFIEGNIDTTVSFGTLFRVQGRDDGIIGAANGGDAAGANADDGNLNYDTGIVSQVSKITSDIELAHKSGKLGAFLRVKAFMDNLNNSSSDTERTPLSNEAMDLMGRHADVLDFYGWGAFDAIGMSGEAKFGKHVLNWGESTFIQGGMNIINPIDVSAMRTPGSEIREALLPVNMFSVALDVTDSLSMESFYQFDWDETAPDPAGSYFSTNDFATDGGDKIQLGWGKIPDTGFSFESYGAGLTAAINGDLAAAVAGGLTTAQADFDEDFMSVSRGANDTAKDGGQWGLNLHYFSEALNDTEFGVYYVNYHSRLPIVSGRTGTDAGVTSGATAAGAILGGANVSGAVDASTLTEIANSIAVDRYADTASYLVEFPEDIDLFGVSFNTDIGRWVLQGEYSFKNDVPLQIDDVELLLAALTPLGTALEASLGYNPFAQNQIGVLGTDEYVQGYIERDVSQLQATLARVFGNTMYADEFTFIAEAAITHVHSMPDKDELRLEGDGTFTSGDALAAALQGTSAESSSHFADATSWGYRLIGRWAYNSAFLGVNLLPHVAFQHDVNGVSPGPGGNFIEDRKALTVGLTATYREQWDTDLSYTSYFGAGDYNLLNDRDYVSFNLKYSF